MGADHEGMERIEENYATGDL